MLFFGHIGIPLATARISHKKIYKSATAKFIESLDYRILIIGALLPDLIDKPLSLYLGKAIGTTQSFGHTLIFAVILLFAGLFLYQKCGKRLFLTLAIGILFHQVLDLVTMNYKNFFWPLYGFKFIQSKQFETSLTQKLINHISSPYYLIGEIVGLIITTYYFVKIYINGRLIDFIKSGKMY